jgi:hypothetical protein
MDTILPKNGASIKPRAVQFPEWEFEQTTVYKLEAKTVRGPEKSVDVAPASFWMIGTKDGEALAL